MCSAPFFESNLRLWDLANGRHVETRSPVLSAQWLAFSPDGRHLAIRGKQLVLWDVVAGQTRHRFELEKGVVFQRGTIAWSPDGGTIAVLDGQPSKIRLWDAETGDEATTIRPGVHDPNSIHYAANGRVLAVSAALSVLLLDASAGELLLRLRHEGDYIHRIAFSPDGQAMATAGGEKNVVLWDVSGFCGPPLRPPTLVKTVDSDADGAPPRAMRTWASSNGKFTVRARLVLYLAGKVCLEKGDGSDVQVSIERLCDKDREYVKSQYPGMRGP
jgi:WD40 repeat protein